MYYSQPIDDLPLWVVYLFTVLLSLVAVEIGYRLGRYTKKSSSPEPSEKGDSLGAIVAATFALMSFFLVFLIGISANRFDNRQELVTAEANAVGTTYLRAGYLDEPYRTTIRKLLTEYVSVRLAPTIDPSQFPSMLSQSEEIHSELWAQAEQLARASPNDANISIFIESLNDVINLHTTELMAISLRISTEIWIAIYAIILLSLALLGFNDGMAGNRHLIAVTILILVFAGVVLLLVDLDRPTNGLFLVSQQPLVDLLNQMKQMK